MILEIVMAIAGLYLIFKGAEWVTDAAVPLASYFNTTSIAIGLVLVSLLLSLPELLVSISSVLSNHAELGIGVIIGSVIVNLGLIVGITAIIKPLKIPRHVITRDGVFVLIATIVVTLMVLNGGIATKRDGVVFLLLLVPYLVNIYEQEKTLAKKERRHESDMITKTLQFTGKIGGTELVIHDSRVIFLAGIAMLLVGAEFFTAELISIATQAGISEMLVGITIGALGLSLPTLAAAVQAVRKGYPELAVSETIGSNIVTLLMTLGVLAIVQPFSVDAITASITAPALLVVTVTFFIFTMRGTISKNAGMVLVGMYLVAMVLEILARTGLLH
jgi:cation:H+ antiporter